MSLVSKRICATLAVLALILCFCVLFFLKFVFPAPEPVTPASSVAELKLRLIFPDRSEEIISLWHDEEKILYYAFIPRAVTGIYAYNPGELRVAKTGEKAVTSGDDLLKSVSFDTPITFEYPGTSEMVVFSYLDELPVFFLETESGNIDFISESKENEEPGTLSVFDENGIADYCGNLDAVHVRGNTSFYRPKKNYVLEFERSYGILGEAPVDKWFLMAQYGDGTKIRTALATEYVRDYTDLDYLDVRYADVYVNGVYEGLYLFGKSRSAETFGLTNLELLNKKENPELKQSELTPIVSEDGTIHAYSLPHTPGDITGGYLLEVITSYEYETIFPAFISSRGICYELKSPDNASLEEVAYIKSVIDEMESAIYSEDGISPDTGKHYSEYIDVSKWEDYYLIKEGLSDGDVIANISIYLSKDSDSKDSRIQAGPVWDIDAVLGSFRPSEYSYLTDAEFIHNALIYADGLLKFPEVRAEIARKIETQLIPWYENDMHGEINELYGQIYDSVLLDRVRWPNEEYQDYSGTPEGNALMISYYMERRADFLRSVYVEGETWHRVSFYSQGVLHKSFMVRDGEHIKYVPNPVNYFGVFIGWSTDSDVPGSLDDIIVTTDMTFEARWIDTQWLLTYDMDSIRNVIEDTDLILFDPDELDGMYEALVMNSSDE